MSEAAPSPAPRPRRSVALAGTLLVLALLYTAWAASSLLIPALLAMFLALIANPIVVVCRSCGSCAGSVRWE